MSQTVYMRLFVAVLSAGFLVAGCQRTADLVVHARARAVSQPVSVNEVQDAAIWVHPSDPAKSLLLITNEKKGLEVHDVDGLLLKHLENGICPCYVDVLYEMPMGDKVVDLALATCRAPASTGVKVWQIDSAKRKLVDVTAGTLIHVMDDGDLLGLCTYHSPTTGRNFFFVTSREGRIEQYELLATPDGHISAQRVRAFSLPGEVKSCVADDERGVVYLAQDDVGVWRYPAEPDAPAAGKCVIRVGEHGLIPNVKGPALYCAAGGRGYLLVVSQGPKGGKACVKVYQREGDNAFVLTIDPSPKGYGPVEHTAGLAVSNQSTTRRFPKGVLVINDQINPNASEDFKIYSWEEIARAGRLLVDTTWSPRPSRAKP